MLVYSFAYKFWGTNDGEREYVIPLLLFNLKTKRWKAKKRLECIQFSFQVLGTVWLAWPSKQDFVDRICVPSRRPRRLSQRPSIFSKSVTIPLKVSCQFGKDWYREYFLGTQSEDDTRLRVMITYFSNWRKRS